MSILASNDSHSFAPHVDLFAGDAPVITNRAEGAATTVLAARTVIALDATDKIVAWNPAGAAPVNVPVGILCEALDTTAHPGSWAPYYTGGDFNHEALVWPVSIDTFAERRAAFGQTSTIKISKVLG